MVKLVVEMMIFAVKWLFCDAKFSLVPPQLRVVGVMIYMLMKSQWHEIRPHTESPYSYHSVTCGNVQSTTSQSLAPHVASVTLCPTRRRIASISTQLMQFSI